MKLTLLIILTTIQTLAYSQVSDDAIVINEFDFDTIIDTNEVYQIVEEQPEFPGGGVAMKKYILEELEYPAEALKNKIEGRVYINFIIERDGSVSNVKNVVLKGRETDNALIKEAIRIVKSMPKWKPGKQRGKAVRVKYTIPILFRIKKKN